jgi:pilus assembly protein CpaC
MSARSLLGTTCLLAAGLALTGPAMAQIPPAARQGNIPQSNLGAAQGDAQSLGKPYQPVRAGVTLSAGSGQVIHLPAAAANVFTADPKVAEVRPASANSLFVFGVAPGMTTVAALGANGEAIGQYQVSVVPSGYDAAMARSAIAHSGRQSVNTRATETGVSISGHVATPGDADRTVAAAKGALPPDGKVDNRLRVDQPIQVGLHVRIAEMTRTLTRALGVNWGSAAYLGKDALIGAATGNAISLASGITPSEVVGGLGRNGHGGFDLTTVIDALSQDQLVHVLAEPNLTAMSGQPASFLVGGEFPIPVATSNNTVSIEFKQYGISLAFVPTVVGPDRISLHVRPEVSQLDKANGVTSILNSNVSVSIPALTVRRADTTVELGSGQSFAIAGLLSDQTTQITQATPGLGDLPVLGALFRSDSFQRAESELVIVVTPYIVRPVSDPAALHLPTDGFRAPNDFERILEARQLGRGSWQAYGRIPADAGFIIE